MTADAPVREISVLVYSNEERVRERVRLALGRHPVRGLRVDFTDAATSDEVVRLCDDVAFDLAILDGEAWPTGGMGLCRQLKDEVAGAPPVLLLVGRRDDAWLATWSRAEGVVPHPVDPVQLVAAVTRLVGAGTASPLVRP